MPKPLNVLVLDDREDSRYLLEVLLRGNGFAVESAANGVIGLEKLGQGRFDLIISDILMPGMDGYQFCRQVKAGEEWCRIPFIFYTGTYTGPQDEEFARRLGADRFVVKPCEPVAFIGIVREVLAGSGGSAPTTAGADIEEEEVLRLYSERLVRKLEQKMLQSERDARALDEEKRKFQVLVDELPLGVVLIDETGRFRYVNPRFTSLFGYTLADLPDSDAWMAKVYPDPEVRAERLADWKQALKERTSPPASRLIVRIRCHDGSDRQVRIRPSFLASGDQVVTYEDVSEQVRLETQLRQAQKLEAIATLAGGIAHDFNNILTAVMGFAELADHDVAPDSKAARHIGGVLLAANRARQLVGHILAFSRQSEQERVPLALHLVVKEVLTLLRSMLPTTIEIRQHTEREGVVFADPTQMHQVLMNLCTNGFQAMREKGGILEVALKKVVLGPETSDGNPGLPPGEYLLLTVRDTGCGMTPEVMARIYDPYFTTKPEGEGTGLGLSVTLGIVESHGGKIDVVSEAGVGTAFHIHLPCMANPPKDVPGAEEETLPTGRERILFVDDEPALTSLVQELLTDLGYRVEIRNGATEALDVFRADPSAFDLVITDLTMPRLTGLELATELHRLRPGLPVLLCSGDRVAIGAARIGSNEFRGFVMKPFSRRELALLVRRVFEEKPQPTGNGHRPE